MIKKVEEKNKTENAQVALLTDPAPTQRLPPVKSKSHDTGNIKATEPPKAIVEAEKVAVEKTIVAVEKVEPKKKKAVQAPPSSLLKQRKEKAQTLRTRCKQLCIAAFFQGQASIHSLGFTSAISGEGKSFLARLAAEVMAEDDSIPVTLLECNWENATLRSAFHLPQGPGLADWLKGECDLAAIRHQVHPNLTLIPAGESKNNAIGLLRMLQQRGVHDMLTRPNELLIVDLPSITTTPYGQLAASLFDTLVLVVRMGVTPESFIDEANSMLKDLPVEGVIFNQVKSVVPEWLRQIM